MGRQKKRAISTWNNRIELLAMVEDTHDGRFFLDPPTNGGAIRRTPGRWRSSCSTTRCRASIRVREQANAAMKKIAERKGLGRFMKLTETQGGYASHPLGGCRMAESAEFGVVDHRCEAFGNEGLFCMDSSRSHLARRQPVADDRGSVRAGRPRADGARSRARTAKSPGGFRHRTPARFLGERYVPKRGGGLKVVRG